MSQIICVYVGQEGKNNLKHDLVNGIWGFKDTVAINQNDFPIIEDPYFLFASGYTGGSPTVQPEEWILNNLETIYLAKITDKIKKYEDLELSDEKGADTQIYPNRFHFDTTSLSTYQNIKIKKLPDDISEALRNSAIAQSRGNIVSGIDIQVLRGILSENKGSDLIQEITHAIQSEEIQSQINNDIFQFEIAQNKMMEFDSISESPIGIYSNLYSKFIESKKTYSEFIKEFQKDSEDYNLLIKIGQIVSYCDANAANKKELNEYDDKHTLANSSVRQTDWLKSLLKYKINNNNINELTPSIKNAISYLKNPSTELTMISENHREMVSNNLLKQDNYDKDTFVKSVLDFFSPYNIRPKNTNNLTRIISNILYNFPEVKKLWLEKVEGLVVCDSTNWLDDAIKEKSNSKYITLWLDKTPSGGQEVIKLLKKTIQSIEGNYFYIYYSIRQIAIYRARIIDFALEDEYVDKNWNKDNNVAWYKPSFAEYCEKKENGSEKSAKIVFLADELEKLKTPIKMEHFKFYKNSKPPTQNNMQPFTEVNLEVIIDTTPPKVKGNSMTTKEIIDHSFAYIRNKGFQYQKDEIANFYLSLKAKPFVILAGISGTGKTQLPRQFASSIGMGKDQLIQIPVRPDWTDGSDLLGYVGLDNIFKPKGLTNAIIIAQENSDKPYFFVLDEMNLARVEHYFSEFLSIIETRERINGIIKTDPILRVEFLHSENDKLKYGAVGWPQNLYLIGTVNMDETTHTFSRKVLDRANSIEMNEVDLNWADTIINNNVDPLDGIDNSFMETLFLSSKDLSKENRDSIEEELKLLIAVNKILEKADLHFAYRVRDEVAFYLLTNKKHNLLNSFTALDFQLVQKVLPRIHGSSERIQVVLVELLNLLEGTDFRSTGFEYSNLNDKIDFENLKYKRTSKKILFMLKRFDDDRFTSFWL